ncbi:hypothetical protein [uncultured Akkermansia sp.]|jgi:hypothetical protein|uniref:hypothetical protein n=1 Tax=uncultured Akkermansia sp. TaxID=512294 RepID=UPI0025DFF6BA|nr:hypothetical protein [uncultured Akkermansia sp.]
MNVFLRTVCVLCLTFSISWGREFIAIERILKADYSSVIVDGVRNQLRKQLDSGTLSPEKIWQLVHDSELEQLCHIGQFFRHAGKGKAFQTKELRDNTFTKWLVSHPEVFQKMAHAGYAQQNSLAILYRLWNNADKKLCGVDLNIALGACLISDVFTIEECIARYEFYHDSHHHGRCYPQADGLEPWEWAVVLRGKESLEDLAWAQQFIEGKKIKPEQAGGKFTGFIPYRMKNHKGISVHAGAAFYDNKPITLKLYTEYGGVCGAVSKGAAGFLRSKGVPAYPIGQPGHCAFIWKHPKGQWFIGNNIGGWNWANGGNKLPWNGPVQIITTLCAFWQSPRAKESSLMYDLSFYSLNPQHVELLLQEACRTNPHNYPAWVRYLGIKAGGVSDKKKLEYLILFSKAMPREHNLIHYVANHVLKINPGKVNPYEVYTCGVCPDSTPEAEELFIRQFWNKLTVDCPEIKTHAVYKEGITGDFLNLWLGKSKNIKWNSKVKNKVSMAFQQALLTLVHKEKFFIRLIKNYRRFLIMWDDEKYMIQAHEFVQDHLKNIANESVKKEMISMGRKMGVLLKNDRILKMYDRISGT